MHKLTYAQILLTGNMCDPEELPGLAHFCEHMLFLGTKKVRDFLKSKIFNRNSSVLKLNRWMFLCAIHRSTFYYLM